MNGLITPKDYIGSAIDLSTGDVCGEEGHWSTGFIPDSYFKVDIKNACKIHDFMYEKGKTHEDKAKADIYFLNNLLILLMYLDVDRLKYYADDMMNRLDGAYSEQSINDCWKWYWRILDREVNSSKVNWFVRFFRYRFAKLYYFAVDKHGSSAFWKGKRSE